MVTPSSVTYAHAINACQQAETPNLGVATTLISWALDDGVQPTVYMFAPAIWAAQKSGESARALDYFLQMVDLGCTPNEVAYNGVVSALCDNGDVEHAILMYEEMKNGKMNLNSAAFKVRLPYSNSIIQTVICSTSLQYSCSVLPWPFTPWSLSQKHKIALSALFR